MTRCPECGTRSERNASQCPGCGSMLFPPQTMMRSENPRPRESVFTAPPWPQPAEWIRDRDGLPMEVAERTPPARVRSQQPISQWPFEQAEVTGEVLAVENGLAASAGFSMAKLVAGLLWLCCLIPAPFVLLDMATVHLGPVGVLVLLVGGFVMVKIAGGVARVLHWCFWLPILFCRQPSQPLPVRHLRVRDEEGQEMMVSMRGSDGRSVAMEGDLLTCRGRWRHGVLDCKSAYSHNARCWIRCGAGSAWPSAVAAAIVLIGQVLYLNAAMSSPIALPRPVQPIFLP